MVLTRSMVKKMDNYTFEEYHPVYKRKYNSNNISYSEMMMSISFIVLSSSIYYYMVINSIIN